MASSTISLQSGPTAAGLADEFVRIMRQWLSVEQLAMIDQRNRSAEYADGSCCASHEFCDPNQAMLDAMDCLGMEYDPSSEKQTSLTCEAWSIASARGFCPTVFVARLSRDEEQTVYQGEVHFVDDESSTRCPMRAVAH